MALAQQCIGQEQTNESEPKKEGGFFHGFFLIQPLKVSQKVGSVHSTIPILPRTIE
jgi:hypothetical protein